jgi:hypothetical protein
MFEVVNPSDLDLVGPGKGVVPGVEGIAQDLKGDGVLIWPCGAICGVLNDVDPTPGAPNGELVNVLDEKKVVKSVSPPLETDPLTTLKAQLLNVVSFVQPVGALV